MAFAKVDYERFKAFRKDLLQLRKDHDKFLKEAIQNIALRAIAKIKLRTPVDTGTLRNAWQIIDILKLGNAYIAIITNGTDYVEHVEYGHRVRQKKLKAKAETPKLKVNTPEAVQNKKKKAVKKKPMKGRVKNGYVPGIYMMTISMREIEKEMDVLLLREFEKYLRRAFT